MDNNNTSQSFKNAALNKMTAPTPRSTAAPTKIPVSQQQQKPVSTAKPNQPTQQNIANNMQAAVDATQESCNVRNISAPHIMKAINESEDIVTALESVAAMYAIPTSNIACDDSLSSIQVCGDCIKAPSLPTEGHAGSIIRSISAVLDYISQRVDNKLNDYQSNNIMNGVLRDHIQDVSNPSKGTVIGRYIDANGDELIAYDSGLVDMGRTPAAVELLKQLKATNAIPECKQSDDGTYVKPSYFSDEDDITNGVIDNTPTVPTPTADAPTNTMPEPAYTGQAAETTDIADNINESYDMLDTISMYNNTRHLGYNIMQEYGFDFVKPLDFFQEAKTINPQDIKHMKFDNTNILKAIKYFNMCREEQGHVEKGHLDMQLIVQNPNWTKAIDALSKQFDARITVRVLVEKDNNTTETSNAITLIFGEAEMERNLKISKSKGFQLNGKPINIFVMNKIFDTWAPADKSLWGQFCCSILCHEIFHNIMNVLRAYEVTFSAALASTLEVAGKCKSARVRRKLMTNFVNTVESLYGMKMNIVKKRIMIKELTILASIQYSKKDLITFQKAIEESRSSEEEVDKYIRNLEKYKKKLNNIVNPNLFTKVFRLAIELICILASPWSILFIGSQRIAERDYRNDVKKHRAGEKVNYEEYWCDMFAAMYNLPVHFFMAPGNRTANSLTDEQLKRIVAAEQEIGILSLSTYPTMSERNFASVKAAKKVLESGVKIDPALKKYLEWIVDNYSKLINDTDIETNFSKSTFDPKTADDLDNHVQNLISKANIQLTESYFMSILKEDESISE